MSKLSRKFLKDLECPVCFSYLISPILLCINGHSTCGDCRNKLQQCSLCSHPFLNSRNHTLENIVRRFEYPCTNAERGCTVILPGDQIKKHEESCLLGSIWCPMNKFPNIKCVWVGNISDFATHAATVSLAHQSVHETTFFSTANHTVERLVFAFDEIFLYYKLKRNARWYFIVMLVGNAARSSKYKSIFTLNDDSGINKIVFISNVKHYGEDFNTIINNFDCSQIEEPVAAKFVRNNCELQMTVEIALNE